MNQPDLNSALQELTQARWRQILEAFSHESNVALADVRKKYIDLFRAHAKTHIHRNPNNLGDHRCAICKEGYARDQCFCLPPVECPPLVQEKGVWVAACNLHPKEHRFHTHHLHNDVSFYSTLNDIDRCMLCVWGGSSDCDVLFQ